MPRLRERNTGSVVNVPDAQVGAVLALGYYELVDEPSKAKKAAPKKASSSK